MNDFLGLIITAAVMGGFFIGFIIFLLNCRRCKQKQRAELDMKKEKPRFNAEEVACRVKDFEDYIDSTIEVKESPVKEVEKLPLPPAKKVKETPTPPAVEDEYLSIKQAAELYGCSYGNMHTHVAKGNIESFKKGRSRKVKRSDVLNFKSTRGKKSIQGYRDYIGVALKVLKEGSNRWWSVREITDKAIFCEYFSNIKNSKGVITVSILTLRAGIAEVLNRKSLCSQVKCELRMDTVLGRTFRHFKFCSPEVDLKEVSSQTSPLAQEEYLRIQQAADLHGCSYNTMYIHIKKGNIESFTIKGKQVVKEADILKFKSVKDYAGVGLKILKSNPNTWWSPKMLADAAVAHKYFGKSKTLKYSIRWGIYEALKKKDMKHLVESEERMDSTLGRKFWHFKLRTSVEKV